MTFKPEKGVGRDYKHLGYRATKDQHKAVSEAAKRSGVSASEFVRQAVQYAIDNMESDK